MSVLHILCVEYMVTYIAHATTRGQYFQDLFKAAVPAVFSTRLSYSLTHHSEQTFLTNSIYSNVSNNEIKCPKLFRKLLQLCQTWHAHVTPYWFIF